MFMDEVDHCLQLTLNAPENNNGKNCGSSGGSRTDQVDCWTHRQMDTQIRDKANKQNPIAESRE